MIDPTVYIDYLGTFAFAISGIRSAEGKNFDLFGAYIVGLVTAIGGGTLRDLFLGVTPFWMVQPSYLVVTGIALAASVLFYNATIHLRKTMILFDAIGLGLFVVVGIEKTLQLGFPFWVAIVMGMITGSVGGVIRDVLVNEVPMLFRRDIYALACAAGGVVYALCYYFDASLPLTRLAAAGTVIATRLISLKYNVQLPEFKGRSKPG